MERSYIVELFEFLAGALLDSRPLRRPQAVVSINTQGATSRSFAADDPRRPPPPADEDIPPHATRPQLFLPRQIDPVTDSPFTTSFQYTSPSGAAAPMFPQRGGRMPRLYDAPVVGPLQPTEAWRSRKGLGDKTTRYGTPCLQERPTAMIQQWPLQALPDSEVGAPSRFMRFGGTPRVIG